MKDGDAHSKSAALLRRVDAFAALDEATLARVAALVEWRQVARGETLIREGDEADDLFIVAKGRFWVLSGDEPIAEIEPGEPIGELAFFAGGVRSANVVAARNSAVMALTKSAYDQISAETPALSRTILSSVSKRLMQAVPASPKLRPRTGKTMGVFPGAGGTLEPSFVRGLVTAFDGVNGWNFVTETDVPAEVRQDASALEALLDAKEANANLVLAARDPGEASVWARTVARGSDATLIVLEGQAGADHVSALEEELFAGVLPSSLHYAVTRPTGAIGPVGTSVLLGARPKALHHHVALDQPQDFERLARFVRGEALGLVLCGGGAFGTAHLGAIKALLEAGISFDFLGGTSVGAAMAGAISIGLAPDRVMDLCEDIFLRSRAMSRWTVPRHSVLDHRALDEGLHRHYGDVSIEDVPMNFFAIATSLTSNDITIIRDGPLWKSIRASGSLPGLFPPFLTETGEVLIDGGLLDNLPVTAMRDLKAGPNLILNFEPEKPWRVQTRYEDLPGRIGAFFQMLRPPRQETEESPTLFSILSRSMAVNAQRLIGRTDVGSDVLLNIRTLPGMTFMNWDQGRAMFEDAYQQMKVALGNDAEEGDPIERIRRATMALGKSDK